MHALRKSAFLGDRNWGSTEPLARWYGVDTDSKGRVTGVGLSNMNLPEGATLPATLGKLAKLERFAVANNEHLGGEVPRELADLHKLQLLDLSGTDLFMPLSRARLKATGWDPKRDSRERVKAFTDGLFFVPVASLAFDVASSKIGIRWSSLAVAGVNHQAKQKGVRVGWHAVAVDGDGVPDRSHFCGAKWLRQRLDDEAKAQTARGGTRRDVTIDFIGRAPWAFNAANGKHEATWRLTGQEEQWPTSQARISVVSHSFRLSFRRAIVSRSDLEA